MPDSSHGFGVLAPLCFDFSCGEEGLKLDVASVVLENGAIVLTDEDLGAITRRWNVV